MHACACILVPMCAEKCWVYLCVARSGCLMHALSTCCCVCIPPYRDQWVLKLKMCLGVAALLTSDRPQHATMNFTSYPSLGPACGLLCSSRHCKQCMFFEINFCCVTVGSTVSTSVSVSIYKLARAVCMASVNVVGACTYIACVSLLLLTFNTNI